MNVERYPVVLLLIWLLGESFAFAFDPYDRALDIWWYGAQKGDAAVWYMDRVTFRRADFLPAFQSGKWDLVAIEDFNRDNSADLLWRNEQEGQNAVWLMNGTNRLAMHDLPLGDKGWYVVGTGDFNRDGTPDILWRHRTEGQTRVWTMGGSAGTEPTGNLLIQPSQSDADWVAALAADFNNDGSPDIVWRHKTSGYVWIWLMEGTSRIYSVKIDSSPGPDYSLAGSGSFTPLGKTDLLWQHKGASAGTTKVWYMNGIEFLRAGELVDGGSYKPVVVDDRQWKLAGTSGFRTERMLSASVQNGTNIFLSWLHGSTRPVSIERRRPGENRWNVLARDHRPMRYLDTNVVPGERYEYQLSGFSDSRMKDFILAGCQSAAREKQGRVLLLIDKTLAGDRNLKKSIEDLERDLIGDGYTVEINPNGERHDESSSALKVTLWGQNKNRVAKNKRIISSFYEGDSSENHYVLLIGHIAIPHSGGAASDNHHSPTSNHQGAWTADAFYGDVVDDQLWTDTSQAAVLNSSYPQSRNSSNDGKFDQDILPSDLEIAVGRIDFAGLNEFQRGGESAREMEIRLLTQYFKKNHRFRHGDAPFPLPNKLMVGSCFSDVIFSKGRTIFDVALRLGSRSFGLSQTNLIEGDLFSEKRDAFLWGALSAPGNISHITHKFVEGRPVDVYSKDLTHTANEPRVGFYMLHGSWLADFNLAPNNIYLALLATPNYGLAALGSSSGSGPSWYVEPLGLGETLGAAFLHSIKVQRAAGYSVDRWYSLLGDPTLRLRTTFPPSGARWNEKDQVLSWTASRKNPDQPGITYLVERSTGGWNGPWARLGISNITAFTDHSAPPGKKLYRIRAQNLISTGSGSFYNLSQAAFCSIE